MISLCSNTHIMTERLVFVLLVSCVIRLLTRMNKVLLLWKLMQYCDSCCPLKE